MTKDMWIELARHLLTTAGGFAVGKGYIDSETMAASVGALVVLVGTVWSLVEKKKKAS